ncbi:MAG TPA: VOC family protein [Ktedonobacteraceae bacterium]|nr:VOC family protein [Ktedonobacteraceae bacterium]
MPVITPHLWFDKEAKVAAEFYTSLLPDSKVTHITTLHNTPSGDCDVVSFVLANQPFMAISAGPLFKFNPSISFHIKLKTKEEVDAIWEKLSSGGKVLMPLNAYPFSERFGWVEDKYGLSWQVIYAGNSAIQQTIMPALMFVGAVCGKTEEAITLYTSVFQNAHTNFLQRYGKGEEPDKEGTVRYGEFTLNGMEFGAMDSAHEHSFAFNEAISFLIPCETQAEIDYYWEKLSADPQAEQCGWLKDKFGLSWQVWPIAVGEMMQNGTREQIDRITQAFLPMKKFDIATLQKAYALQ